MNYRGAVEYAASCDVCLVPYENETGMKSLKEAAASIKQGDSVSVLIGPEGGFAEEEIALVRNGMQVVSLGRRILRTDTAGIAVMAMLMLESEIRKEQG